VSVPVISGFTSAASITIVSGQVKGLLGLTMAGKNSSSVVGITGTWIDIVNSIETIRYQDSILGVVCIIVLLLLRVQLLMLDS
jgi:sodium-independent sulfate anion transporter 11